MDDLRTHAINLLNEKYNPPVHSVAAALQASSGKIYSAVNIDHFLGFVCAEAAALAIAINQGEYDFVRVSAVRKDEEGNTTIANMCGKCRQIFHDYTPGLVVDTIDGDKTIDELLPHAFARQREKIESVLKRENA